MHIQDSEQLRDWGIAPEMEIMTLATPVNVLDQREAVVTLIPPHREVSPPFVSIIIPIFNDAERIVECLKRLCRQSYPSECFEVIVVDNGSTDDLQPVREQFPQVIWLEERAPGSYAARNRGLQHCRGEILAFTDADCQPADDWVESGVRALEHSPEVAFVGGRVETVCRDPKHPSVSEYHQLILAFHQHTYIQQRGFSVTANLFARRWLFEKIGPFNSLLKSSGDREWGLRATAAGFPPKYDPKIFVGHPARQSISELQQKILRLTGGRMQMARAHDYTSWQVARTSVRGCWSAVRTIWQSPTPLSLPTRLKVIGIEIYLLGGKLYEQIRISCGGLPRRQ